MAREMSVWTVALGLVLSFGLGCSDDGDGSGDGSGFPGSDAGGGGGSDGGGGGSVDGCEPPAGAEVVMPWTAFPDEDGMTGPAYGLITDGTLLYANFRDRLVTVPLDGGSPTEVWRSPREIPILMTMWADTDRILMVDSGDWYELPWGGTAVAITVPLPLANGIFDFDPATDTFYATVDDFTADNVDVVSAVVGDATPTVLFADQTVGLGRNWYRAGDRFYTQESTNDDFTNGDIIYVFEPGAVSPASLTLTPTPSTIAGTTSTALYFSNAEDPSTWGVYRVAHGGGTVERIWDGYFLGGLGGVQSSATQLYGNDANYLWRITDGQNLVQITPVPAGGCTTHEVLGHNGFVYTVTFNDDSGENQVWRIAE